MRHWHRAPAGFKQSCEHHQRSASNKDHITRDAGLEFKNISALASGRPGTLIPQHMHTAGIARHWDALCAPGPPTRCKCGGQRREVLGLHASTQILNLNISKRCKRAPRDVESQHMQTVGIARHWDALHASGPPTRCECGVEGRGVGLHASRHRV